ncbi:hypothetical protein D3C73_1431500 [compost metagenome]
MANQGDLPRDVLVVLNGDLVDGRLVNDGEVRSIYQVFYDFLTLGLDPPALEVPTCPALLPAHFG